MKKLNYYGNKYERVIRAKRHQGDSPFTRSIKVSLLLGSLVFGAYQYGKDFNFENIKRAEAHEYISPLPTSVQALATNAAQLSETPTVSGETVTETVTVGVTNVQKYQHKTPTPTPTPTAIPTPTELELVVAYIARKFEGEGKDVVVQAINCFYSESGLRPQAVGQNNDAPKSRDYGVAQLNSYWHNLTEEQKTEYKANIDKAYEIYKGWGDSFNPWYGKGCR